MTSHDELDLASASRNPGATHRALSSIPALAIDDANIDVWLTRYDRIDDLAHLDVMRRLLDEDERSQEHVFHFADDRKRYMVTRAMVRTTLSRYVPMPPESWRFEKNEFGRPEIAKAILDARPDARGLRFNLSHTRGLIALAVSKEREVGIDVEHLCVRNVSLGIAHRFFSGDEVRDLAAIDASGQQDRFFEYWTFKESYIKARGMGLSLPLDGFSFEFPRNDAVRIHIDPSLEDDDDRWAFWQYRPATEYLLALCAERRGQPPPRVNLRASVPLLDANDLALPLLRRSCFE